MKEAEEQSPLPLSELPYVAFPRFRASPLPCSWPFQPLRAGLKDTAHEKSSTFRQKRKEGRHRLIASLKRASITNARHAQSHPEGGSASYEATITLRPRSCSRSRNLRLGTRACRGPNACPAWTNTRSPLLLVGRDDDSCVRRHLSVQLHPRRDAGIH